MYISWSSCCGAAEMNPTRNHEVVGLIPDLAQWIRDLALLWLWLWPAAAAPIRPLAWLPPYATGAALKIERKKGKKNEDKLIWEIKTLKKRRNLKK